MNSVTKKKFSVGVVANMMDSNITVSEFELQLRYYVHFRTNNIGKGVYPHIPPAIGKTVVLLSYHKDGFGIK